MGKLEDESGRLGGLRWDSLVPIPPFPLSSVEEEMKE